MIDLYLVCGVSGSGKTWVCEQLTNMTWVPHDKNIVYKNPAASRAKLAGALFTASHHSKLPLVTECPFGERELVEYLSKGFSVKPYFIVEPVEVVQERFFKRERYHLLKNVETRAVSIKQRAIEWGCPYGTSEEVLKLLKNI